jgi:plastocyanin
LQITAGGDSWVTAAAHTIAGTVCLAAPAGTFTVTLHSDLDPYSTHNFSIYTDSNAGNTLFHGDSVRGDTITYHVSSLPRGVYFFRCDYHPQSMIGVLVVK